MVERTYVALDLETTGLDANRDRIIEIGAVRFTNERIVDHFTTLINPERPIPLRVQQLTGIRDADVAHAPTLARALPEFLAFVDRTVTAVVAHNADFDMGFLHGAGIDLQRPALDTFELASIIWPDRASYNLGELCREEGITLVDAHRALDDARATALLFMRLWRSLCALPPAIPQAILQSSRHLEREVNWPPLLLFEEALRRVGLSFGASTADLTSLLRPRNAHDDAASSTPLREPHSRTDRAHLEASVPAHLTPEALDALFTADGPLAQQMNALYEARAGQVEMAQRVLRALNEGDHLLVEAGTGIGKTLAYLLPAALWSATHGRRVVIATNTIALQNQLLENELPRVKQLAASQLSIRPAALRTALLKGRAHYLCLRRLHRWRQRSGLSPLELRVLARILVWLPITQQGDVEEIFLPSPAERRIWSQVCADAAACTDERCAACQRGEVAVAIVTFIAKPGNAPNPPTFWSSITLCCWPILPAAVACYRRMTN